MSCAHSADVVIWKVCPRHIQVKGKRKEKGGRGLDAWKMTRSALGHALYLFATLDSDST